MMKEIFQRRVFWMILIILLLTVFVYPPFSAKESSTGVVLEREWGWIFSPPKLQRLGELDIDLRILFVESVIAILFPNILSHFWGKG
jgi:hypothetical protein